jgi:ubiquinone/menaquinone biosynthesis C-methylase UbiE
MCSYVLMKLLESSNRHYDMGINLLTCGTAQRIKEEIALRFISDNDRVFEIGVGTGTLAILCAQRGAYVTGIDVSQKMLTLAQRKVDAAQLTDNIDLKTMSVVTIENHVSDCSFTKVVSTLVFSELSEAEQRFALREAFRILMPNGKLILAADVQPRSFGKRLLYHIIQVPLIAITSLFTKPTSTPVTNLRQKITGAHFSIEHISRYFFDSLELLVAIKEDRV